jgi:hypothetical protein
MTGPVEPTRDDPAIEGLSRVMEAPFGGVDEYVAMFRRVGRVDHASVYVCFYGLVGGMVSCRPHGDTDAALIERLRNALAAAAIIRDEQYKGDEK